MELESFLATLPRKYPKPEVGHFHLNELARFLGGVLLFGTLLFGCSPHKESTVRGESSAGAAGSNDDGTGSTNDESSGSNDDGTGSTNDESSGPNDDSTGPSSDDGENSMAQVYLLFGQSNMWGVPASEEQDRVINPRVEVMALTNCSGQTKGEWHPAQPPLHGCIGNGNGNPGLGPGDSFAKTVAEAYPEATILLIPNAIPGESIDTFAPGEPAYISIVDRAKKAQQRGTIRALLFHQGESDTGQQSWLGRVDEVVEGLRSDLNIGNVPFIAGELPYDGCCGAEHNPIINQLPEHVENSHVVSAEGLTIMDDGLHFDASAQRELGKRYAETVLPLLSE